MIEKFKVKTPAEGFVRIEAQVREAIKKFGIKEGMAVVFCPHTTAAVTINEGYDPDVRPDMQLGLDEAFPDRAQFRHAEGNSAAHIKSSVISCSQTLIVHDGEPLLGTWQTIYLSEFDGPRTRDVIVKVVGA